MIEFDRYVNNIENVRKLTNNERLLVIYKTYTKTSKLTYSWPEFMVYLTVVGLGGQPLVLGPTADTYVK